MQPSINLPTSDIERIPGVAHFLILCNCNGGPSLMKPLATPNFDHRWVTESKSTQIARSHTFFFWGGGVSCVHLIAI